MSILLIFTFTIIIRITSCVLKVLLKKTEPLYLGGLINLVLSSLARQTKIQIFLTRPLAYP